MTTTTSTIGLALGGEFTRMAVLDAAGELLEETSVRSTEAGIRQRFASLPPSLIAAQYDDRYAHLLAAISSLGHSLVLSGDVPGYLRPALLPAVQRFLDQGRRHGAPARSLVLQSADPGLHLGFALTVDPDGELASPCWYFIGPLSPGTDLNVPELAGFAAGSDVSSLDQARRLHQLITMGELPVRRHRQEVAA